MESAEDLFPSVAPAPVFVDDTGRRRVLTRRAGRVLVSGFAAYLGLMVVGFARDPRVGPIQLPTFGLPSLELMVPPAPSVLGAQATRTGSDAGMEAATSGPPIDAGGAGDAAPGPLTSASGPPAGLRLAPVGSPPGSATPTTSATTTTTSRPVGAGPKSSTTSSSTTTSTTATTTATWGSEGGRGSGQDSEQGTGPVSARGPDGDGAPGQERKPTTPTAG